MGEQPLKNESRPSWPLRSLRSCLRNGASSRAGVGRVRSLAFLSILMFLKLLLRLSYFTGVLYVNRVFRNLLDVSVLSFYVSLFTSHI